MTAAEVTAKPCPKHRKSPLIEFNKSTDEYWVFCRHPECENHDPIILSSRAAAVCSWNMRQRRKETP